MENAAEALKMAGSVLLFVIGLTIAVLSFTKAREALDTVIQFSDREYLTVSSSDNAELAKNYYYVANSSGVVTRNVGLDTIIPALFRAYKENYAVIFKFPDDYYLYEDSDGSKVCKIESIDGGVSVQEFLNPILYRKKSNGSDPIVESEIKTSFNITLYGGSSEDYSLSSKIIEWQNSGYTIKEELGIYNVKDTQKVEGVTIGSDLISRKANEDVKRVITYTIEK